MPFLLIQLPELQKAEIRGKKAILVPGLAVVSQRAPAVIVGTFDDPRPHGVQIDIGQAVDQGVAFFHDHAFEPLTPQCTPAFLLSVVIPGNSLFQFTDQLRQAGPFPPIMGYAAFGKLRLVSVTQQKSGSDVLIRKILVR